MKAKLIFATVLAVAAIGYFADVANALTPSPQVTIYRLVPIGAPDDVSMGAKTLMQISSYAPKVKYVRDSTYDDAPTNTCTVQLPEGATNAGNVFDATVVDNGGNVETLVLDYISEGAPQARGIDVATRFTRIVSEVQDGCCYVLSGNTLRASLDAGTYGSCSDPAATHHIHKMTADID